MMSEEEVEIVNTARKIVEREVEVLRVMLGPGWADTPGSTAQDQEDARTAIELVRWCIKQGWIWRSNSTWMVGKNGSTSFTNIPSRFKTSLNMMRT